MAGKESGKSFMTEFKEFIMRGNVVDMAVGIVIGSAFIAIVTSFVDDIIMPVVGMLMGGVDFSGLSVTVGSATLTYGMFIMSVINFLIIAFVVFLVVKNINKIHPKKEAAPAEPSDEVKLLTEIRDSLKTR